MLNVASIIPVLSRCYKINVSCKFRCTGIFGLGSSVPLHELGFLLRHSSFKQLAPGDQTSAKAVSKTVTEFFPSREPNKTQN